LKSRGIRAMLNHDVEGEPPLQATGEDGASGKMNTVEGRQEERCEERKDQPLLESPSP